jgi:NAD+ diphosphatase
MPDAFRTGTSPRPNPLSDPDFDRAAHRRVDQAWLEQALGGAETRFVVIWRSRALVTRMGETWRAALIPAGAVGESLLSEPVFLGHPGGVAYFAVDASALEPDEASSRFAAHGSFEDLRPVGMLLPGDEAALLAYAKGVLYWRERHRFCGVCGHPTRPKDGGHRLLCVNPACGTEHFPRSDPAVIMLIEYEDKCLLARGARFPGNFISVLAGFVEPGESLEDTVAREAFEECGVRVTDIAYASSQPWPFPSSLMVGFRARALDPTLTLDPSEILEADWYTRDFIRALTDDSPRRIGPKFSISRRLIDDWVDEG